MFTKLDNEFSETNWMNRIATKLMIQENYLSIHLFSNYLSLTTKKRPFICSRRLESYSTEHQLKGCYCMITILYMLPLNDRVKREKFTDFRGFVEIW